MRSRSLPRLAGRRLRAIAGALRAPLAARAAATVVIARLRPERPRGAEPANHAGRPVIAFRAAPPRQDPDRR